VAQALGPQTDPPKSVMSGLANSQLATKIDEITITGLEQASVKYAPHSPETHAWKAVPSARQPIIVFVILPMLGSIWGRDL
jgi:hypothetical protein